MRQFLYVSNTSRNIAASDLNAILETSRTRNGMLGVSGLLLHADGGFLQVLEGEERALRELYGRICTDRRHWEHRLVLDREITDPAFRGWSMGFDRLGEAPESMSVFGITAEAIAGRLSPCAGPVLITMLKTFYRVQSGIELRLAA